jgi:hypothetical protein
MVTAPELKTMEKITSSQSGGDLSSICDADINPLSQLTLLYAPPAAYQALLFEPVAVCQPQGLSGDILPKAFCARLPTL